MAAGAGKDTKKGKSGPTQEQIITKFNQMRQEQRILVNKIGELEAEISEHRYIILYFILEKSEELNIWREKGKPPPSF